MLINILFFFFPDISPAEEWLQIAREIVPNIIIHL